MSQFFDTFPGSAIDSSKWNTTIPASGTVTVGSGQLTLTENTSNFSTIVNSVNAYSLNAAGTDGLQLTIASWTNLDNYFFFFDPAGIGYAFRVGINLRSGSWSQATGYSDSGAWNAAVSSGSLILRFVKNGSNIEFSHSIDNGANWIADFSAAVGSIDTTSIKVGMYVNNATFVMDQVDFAGSAGATVPLVFFSHRTSARRRR